MKDEGGVRSIHRCIAVLRAINQSAPPTMKEVAVTVGLPYATARRITQALVYEGLVECDARSKSYRPTALVQTLSQGFGKPDRLVSKARPHIVRLTAKLGWPVAVTTRVGHTMVVRDSTHDLTSLTFNQYPPGYVLPLLGCASGQVYLAHAGKDERSTIIRGLALMDTRSPLLARFESGELVKQIREDGYATSERTARTRNPGKTSSISVPLSQDGRLVGALTLVVFASTMSIATACDRYLNDLWVTADAISAR